MIYFLQHIWAESPMQVKRKEHQRTELSEKFLKCKVSLDPDPSSGKYLDPTPQ